MSGSGQSRRFAPQPVTSGLRPTPDMSLRCAHGRDGPKDDIRKDGGVDTSYSF